MLDADWVYFRVAPKDMTFVNRIIEGCGYLGVVTALDGKKASVSSGRRPIRQGRRVTF